MHRKKLRDRARHVMVKGVDGGDMSKINVTFRTNEETIRELDAIAAMSDRDRSYLLNEALDGFLELRRWQLEDVDKGIAEADAGLFATEEEVTAAFGRWTGAD